MPGNVSRLRLRQAREVYSPESSVSRKTKMWNWIHSTSKEIPPSRLPLCCPVGGHRSCERIGRNVDERSDFPSCEEGTRRRSRKCNATLARRRGGGRNLAATSV